MSAESAARYAGQAARLPLRVGERAALLGVDLRTEKRWRDGTDVPRAVELVMAWMAAPDGEAERRARVDAMRDLAAGWATL